MVHGHGTWLILYSMFEYALRLCFTDTAQVQDMRIGSKAKN
jgi:hypothetical protein